MSNRSQIIDGSEYVGNTKSLIYTRKCGWVDLGHANPESVINLWKKMVDGNTQTERNKYYEITYTQSMRFKQYELYSRAYLDKKYAIQGSLTESQMRSVVLSILLEVSHDFEQMQGNWLFSLTTDSSYSVEDLVSNLIGFYRAMEPSRDHIFLCEPMSREVALHIWDTYGAVGKYKNKTFRPYLFPTYPNSKEPIIHAQIPWFLDTVKPAKKGLLFKDVK